MSAEFSIFELVLEASLLVKFVMLVLLGFSVTCWAMIFQRSQALSVSDKQLKQFEDEFWSGADLSKLYNEI
ncbi:MAG: Tol-Pal system subunit TolQ, partial [Colwellia sp.]|nr:Tol-Pal system subunit TolQ [Colwellia sp.]